MKDKIEETNYTRVEIIDEQWRAYVKRWCDLVRLATQDDWKTLKVFIRKESDRKT